MSMDEMAAEKLRTLAQRLRPTDLADLAIILTSARTTDRDIARLTQHKFELVAKGADNRIDRIERT